jgi:hypothetical protein
VCGFQKRLSFFSSYMIGPISSRLPSWDEDPGPPFIQNMTGYCDNLETSLPAASAPVKINAKAEFELVILTDK